jgi:Tol biopolymer transport system component
VSAKVVRRTLSLLLAVAALAAVPATAAAVLSGENGRIVLASGRASGDPTALLYLLPVPSNSVGGGTISSPITPPGGQYRHPTWSPDRTKIAYANGNSVTGVFDIFVQDLAAGTGPVQITPTETPVNLSADRPAWSPDGTRIVYEHQPAAASADRQLRVQPANDLQPPFTTTDLTTAGAPFEGKPAWSPDSATVYFHRGDPNTATNADIYRKPAAGGTETLAVSDSGISEFQPSISPDGTKICYTLSINGFNNTADVVVGNITTPPSGGLIVSKTAMVGDYNCTWSPDGQMIAYVNGTFSSGRLVMVRADNTSPLEIELAQDPGGNDFDGNPDWAPDGRPDCPDRTVNTARNTAVTFTVECTDTGPAYERSDVREFADTQPASGTLTQTGGAGASFTYTPATGFTGTVTFLVNSFDALGFGTDKATVAINVQAPGGGGGGGPINGTPGNDTLNGTPGNDVINCGAGNDVVNAGGGDDIINCGPGNDRIDAGAGNDRVDGGSGNDRIAAGSGNDRAVGSLGNDTIDGNSGRDRLGGQSGDDRASGNSGNDRVYGDSGNDRLAGNGGNDRVSGGSGRDRISGNSGRDRLGGGRGNDRLSGGSGNDRVSGDAGPDRLSGGSGRDRLNGGSGRDRCAGGSGRDRGSRCERSSSIP